MVRRCALLASLLVGRVAHADEPAPPPPEDPRAAFGLSPKPPAPAPTGDDARDVFGLSPKVAKRASCEDGRTLGCTAATDPFDPVSPFATKTWLPASYLLRLPVSDARHDQVVPFATGATRDDAGPAFAGATGLENAWTVEGAPIENLRTGAVETRIPLTFMTGMLVEAGGFAARDRVGLGGAIDVELVRGGDHHEVEAHAWAGITGDGRERPIARGAYQLRRIDVEAGPETSLSVVGKGPLPSVLEGRAWYAAGVAPALSRTDFAWRAARLVDVDQDGIPDGFPGTIALETIEDTDRRTIDYVIPAMARVGWQRGRHDVTLTLLSNTTRDSFFLANATRQAAGIRRGAQILDGIAAWRGTWPNTRARVLLAWHRSDRHERAADDDAAAIPQLLTAYVPAALADDPVLAGACSDGAGDPYPMIPNCPVPFGFFASDGAGTLVDTVGDRPTATASIAHRRGDHVIRAGATLEDTRLVTTTSYTGGELDRSILDGHLDRQRFLQPAGACEEVPGTPCAYADSYELAYRTRYTAAYAEDTFSPVPRLRMNGGLRWELMWVGPRLHFSNQWAPRLGVTLDVLGNGALVWWASMGKSFAMLPAGLGPTVIARNETVRDVSLGGMDVDRNIDRGAVYGVADGIAPASQDEQITGLVAGVPDALRGTLWIQHRSLRRGLDNVLSNPVTGEATFDNPGRDGRTPASREALVIAAEAFLAPTPKLSFRATWSYTRAVGSWTGPFDPRQGAVLYGGTDWDLDATNLDGRLPSDAGHRLAFEGERRGKWRGIEVAVATRLAVASGRFRNVLGDSDLGIVQLLPRGAGGRLPMTSQANVRLAASWHAYDLTLDVFNVFDRRDVLATNDIYAGGQVHPISGGSYEDLIFAKNESTSDAGSTAMTASRRSAYGLPTQFQAPVSVVLGLHHAF
ncbi:MAG TPA: hypothetical protein VFQ53_21720 [Kofleriaceae bacterium]|nr:hypothetical protein [Kofleriaceae bacterium]